MTSFTQLLSNKILLKNLEAMDFTEPTEIQVKSIPVVKEGKDIFGIAQTGTGKTASFCLPLIEGMLKKESLRNVPTVLILAPTRELCLQTHESIVKFSEGTQIKSVAIYGGVKQIYQAQDINAGVNFIVATPGRLLDLLGKELIRLKTIETLVLDEADRMLDMGFIDDLKLIIKELPETRQTLFYSATVPDAIREFSTSLLKNPEFIEVTRQSTVADNIDQMVYLTHENHKYQLLKKIMKEDAYGSVLVFTNTKRGAEAIVEYLMQNRIAARAIHGDKKQTEREKSIELFSKGEINLLIATDLVSRGIDVETLSFVINFELPQETEVYVHRIGRTGRAGKSGKAISFCSPEEEKKLAEIEKLTNQTLKREKFEGKKEPLNLKALQEGQSPKASVNSVNLGSNPWYDHSKRAKLDENGKRVHAHPGLRNMKKKKRK